MQGQEVTFLLPAVLISEARYHGFPFTRVAILVPSASLCYGQFSILQTLSLSSFSFFLFPHVVRSLFLCFVLTCSPSFRSFCRPLRCPFFYLSPILFFSPSFLFPSWSGHLLFLSSELKVRTYERNIPSTEIFYGFVNANIPTLLRPLVLPLLLQTLLSTSASCASDKKKCTRESHFTTYPNSSTKTSILYHHGTRFCPDGVYSFRDFSIR